MSWLSLWYLTLVIKWSLIIWLYSSISHIFWCEEVIHSCRWYFCCHSGSYHTIWIRIRPTSTYVANGMLKDKHVRLLDMYLDQMKAEIGVVCFTWWYHSSTNPIGSLWQTYKHLRSRQANVYLSHICGETCWHDFDNSCHWWMKRKTHVQLMGSNDFWKATRHQIDKSKKVFNQSSQLILPLYKLYNTNGVMIFNDQQTFAEHFYPST